jgi:serine/threonine-protein kinase
MNTGACARCGTILAPPGPEGLCAICLLTAALGQETSWLETIQILTPLGLGPSGMTYLAETPDARLFALKMMRVGPGATGIPSRVERLCDAGRRLAHPLIATLHDVAVSADGQPFTITEFWPGLPITTYSDRHRLRASARLALLEQARAAVAYAHRAGVVHGGLKPANLLVAYDAREPLLKVLDFGHASLRDRDLVPGLDEAADLAALDALRADLLGRP